MQPAARVSAAIEVLDAILSGQSAEQALGRWGWANRYAGSKDRAAIRDHVFDALRCRRSFAWLGGAETGRGLMLGACRAAGTEDLFDGSRHGPPTATADENGASLESAPRGVRGDVPDWLMAHFDTSLDDADATMRVLRQRAGVFLRVNLARTTREATMDDLAAEGITTAPLLDVNTALEVTGNARKIAASSSYQNGAVELQDPASQEAILRLPLADGLRVLDLCAGAGGKSLAMAALARVDLTAHDIDPRRMKDLGPRAKRAGARIVATGSPAGLFDIVYVDAPCSGSGTWRRKPEAKWALTPDRLEELTRIQDDLIDQAVDLVTPGGVLAYATCSVFQAENGARIAAARSRHPGLVIEDTLALRPSAQHDGFYQVVFRKP